MTDYERYGEYQASDRGCYGLAVTFLFIGLGIGALAALLLAPRSGKQTRRMLRRKYEDTLENLGDRAEDLRERGEGWLERGGELIERGGEVAHAAREKVAPLTRKMKR